ncbi:MAG: CDP-alcohol phosphatidyltransferase family protein [Planctomycetota bacterium]|jgi:CDP-diacylglycerol--serine O-phosphatidyltransferase
MAGNDPERRETTVNLAQYLPSVATLGNAAAGVLACCFAMNGRPGLGALMIVAAVLLDSLDGVLARSFGADSDFGAQLDSLADVVSFGVAPAVLVGSLLPAAGLHVGWAVAVAYALCAAWRLARFNIGQASEANGHSGFVGLPSTGAGAASATAILMHLRLVECGIPVSVMTLPCVLMLLGALMISRIPYGHAAAILGRLNPVLAGFIAGLFVAGSVLWEFEYLFGALVWTYTFSGPLVTAREKIRAARHA